jgi:Magnesium transporter NIPA
LKERLSFQGKVGCFQCIIGAVVIVLHAPQQSTSDTGIDAFQKQFLSVAFLVYFGLCILVSGILVFWAGPRWGKKNMLVYITVCSLIGSISVVCTQGLGAAIIHSITIENEFNRPFLYILMAIVVVTLLTEINYLNKALNLFNTALVTPTYYVTFTTLTIVSSAVLYGGFQASGADIATVVMGFLIICSGVALLHHSKSQPTQTAVVDSEGNILEIIKDEKYLEEEDEDDDAAPGAQTHRFRSARTAPPGHYDPGPADLFPAPFVGIQRYATTTKRNRALSTKTAKENNEDRLKRHISRRFSSRVTSSNSAAAVDFSHTISMGNTNSGEDGIGRERRWMQNFPNRKSSTWDDEEQTKIPLEKLDDQLGKFGFRRDRKVKANWPC